MPCGRFGGACAPFAPPPLGSGTGIIIKIKTMMIIKNMNNKTKKRVTIT